MNKGRTVFSELTTFLPIKKFRQCVKRYRGNYKVKYFSCLAFAQLTYRESLRDIEACLRSAGNKLYHMGITTNVSKSTLADANENRDWRIYADFAQVLISEARSLYCDDDSGIDLKNIVYALERSSISQPANKA